MSKRFAPIAAFVLLLILPVVVLAGIVFLPITEFKFDVLGDTLAAALPNGRAQVTTTGLQGTSSVCLPEISECDGTQQMTIQQDLQIVIEFTSAGVTGRTQGDIFLPPLGIDVWEHATFRGKVSGEGLCTGSAPTPCSTVDVTMQVSGNLTDSQTGKSAGRVKFDMQGTLVGNGETAAWNELIITSGGIQARTP